LCVVSVLAVAVAPEWMSASFGVPILGASNFEAVKYGASLFGRPPMPSAIRRCNSTSTPIKTTPSGGSCPGWRSVVCAASRSSNDTTSTGRFFRGLLRTGDGGGADIHDLHEAAGCGRIIFERLRARIVICKKRLSTVSPLHCLIGADRRENLKR